MQQVSGEEEVAEDTAEQGDGPWPSIAAGMNRFVWDYRYARPNTLETTSRGAREEALEAGAGPRAVPGSYRVRLTVGDTVLEEAFALLVDPRIPATQADLQAQFDLKLAIRERISETHAAINQIRRARDQIGEWQKRAGDRAAVRDAGRAALDALRSIEAELINLDFEKPRPGPNRLKEKWDALSAMIDESDDAPTRAAFDVYDMLRGQLESQQARLRDAMAGPVKAFSDAVRAEDIPAVAV